MFICLFVCLFVLFEFILFYGLEGKTCSSGGECNRSIMLLLPVTMYYIYSCVYLYILHGSGIGATFTALMVGGRYAPAQHQACSLFTDQTWPVGQVEPCTVVLVFSVCFLLAFVFDLTFET